MKPEPFSEQSSRLRRGGFTLVEILIVVVILGILAAIVLPQFSNASHQARENTLKDDLRFLRTQIAVYTAQHNETAPGYPGGNMVVAATSAAFVEQLTSYTNARGVVVLSGADGPKYGPYLSKFPANPISGKDGVLVTTGLTFPMPDEALDVGWIYNVTTQQIKANLTGADNEGVAYFNY